MAMLPIAKVHFGNLWRGLSAIAMTGGYMSSPMMNGPVSCTILNVLLDSYI